jgi:nucleoside-diphosphate-sugar epimerase
MNILVTGGAGFIGSHIVETLLGRGDRVRVLDNFSSGKRDNLQFKSGADRLELLEADLRERSALQAAVRGVDLVFHLAAFVSVPQSMLDPDACFDVNVAGTVNLLEAARQAGVRKVVLSSSTAVYGNTEIFPTPETAPLAPLSPYALSKQVNELYARLYSHTFHLPVAALRYFNVYGPRQRPDSDYAAAIPIFINRLVSGETIRIFGDGKQSRDFIYVKDVVRANLMAADSDAAGEAFNICTGRETSLLDLLEELSEVAPRQPQVRFEPPRPGDIYRSVGDPGKARAGFGFEAQCTLAEGLTNTVNWMKSA